MKPDTNFPYEPIHSGKVRHLRDVSKQQIFLNTLMMFVIWFFAVSGVIAWAWFICKLIFKF